MIKFLIIFIFFYNVSYSNDDFDIVTYQEYKQINGSSLNYIVEYGDNIYKISQKTGTDVNKIVLLNNIKFPFILDVGEKINLPLPKFHIVKYGQGLSYLSKIYNISKRKLAKINEIKVNTLLVPGMKLKISTLKQQDILDSDFSKKIKYSNKKISSVRIQKKIFEKYSKNTPPVTKYFYNPVKGIILNKFKKKNEKKDIKKYNGILYKARIGEKIIASNSGKILFVGQGPKGMGYVVVIKHNNGMESIYAYLSEKPRLFEGQYIQRGETIGMVKRVDQSDHALLYFEIRKDGIAINPEDYI